MFIPVVMSRSFLLYRGLDLFFCSSFLQYSICKILTRYKYSVQTSITNNCRIQAWKACFKKGNKCKIFYDTLFTTYILNISMVYTACLYCFGISILVLIFYIVLTIVPSPNKCFIKIKIVLRALGIKYKRVVRWH